MQIIYELGIRIYHLSIRIASLFITKADMWIKGRKHLWANLPAVKNRDVYWFHCASLGEFDQGLPLMNLWRQRYPHSFILVTFFSPSGLLHYHKRDHPADFVCYLPLDTAKNAQRFVGHFHPKAVFLVKYEFWINHISAIKRSGAALYSISTILRESQVYFRWYGHFFLNTLRKIDHFFVQNHATAKLLQLKGIDRVVLTGDTRFDRVLENKKSLVDNSIIRNFVGESYSVFIAGSTWEEDEKLLHELVRSSLFEKYILVPHNVDEKHIQSLIDRLSVEVVRYSDTHHNTSNILIVDSIGQLASAYSYAQVAYVGGGFSGNLHNILEPAVFGLPVIFGPKFSRFPEARSFIDTGIGYSVRTPKDLRQIVEKIRMNRDEISALSMQYVESNRGASDKIIAFLQTSHLY